MVERYWRFPEIESTLSLNEAAEQLAHLARRSVQNQLVADVPVGAFLSGGLDSSTIVALASEFHRGIKTFSFGFEGSYNEHAYAKEIADRYATDHYELSATDHDIASLLGEMQDIYDEPFGDSSNIPTYLISKLARKHVTVALSGDAGDELFGGYGFWYTPLAAMEGKKRATFAQDTAVRIVARTAAAFKWKSQAYWSRQRTEMDYRYRMKSIVDAHLHKPVLFNDQELRSLLGEDFRPRPFTLDTHWKKSNTVNDALKMDLEDYLPGDILVKTDRASMANSLELRAPFLDVELAEFAIALPSRLKINVERDKIVMREAFQHLWSDRIRARGKAGFGAPVDIWLQKPDMMRLAERILADPAHPLFTYVDHKAAAGHRNDRSYKTWTLLCLGLWAEQAKRNGL
jgi:asparagine synthase (glutamine-hydrolysing)